jgi:regulatory protein
MRKKLFSNEHPNDPQYAFNSAARYLSLRARSTKEIENYLTKKGFVSNIISQTILRLKELNFLNDEEFGKSFARSRQNYKGKSKYFISYELKKKGISDDIINVISKDTQDDLVTARAFVERKKEFTLI